MVVEEDREGGEGREGDVGGEIRGTYGQPLINPMATRGSHGVATVKWEWSRCYNNINSLVVSTETAGKGWNVSYASLLNPQLDYPPLLAVGIPGNLDSIPQPICYIPIPTQYNSVG